jgi:ParB-like chromosome segregation protein Spo0J
MERVVSGITPELESLARPIDDFRMHPSNPRRPKVADIEKALRRFGQLKPIVVQQSTGYVVARSRVWEAAKRLGWPTVAAVVSPMDDLTAMRFLVADNRTSDLGDYDSEAVLELLEQVDSLEGTGYSVEDVDDLIARVEAAAAAGEAPDEMREVVLTMGEGSHATLSERLARLKATYGVASDEDAVWEAVQREVEAVKA